MALSDYHFITHWQVESTVGEVADILSDPNDLVRWWPSVYLEVKEIEPGDKDGIGKVVELYTKGWLPYTLRWRFRVTKSDYPYRFEIEALGDFVGRGIWTLEQAGSNVNITYDWKIRAAKPLLKYGSIAIKPIFAANHKWAMQKGLESLKLEIARRKAETEAAKAKIAAPPKPTTSSPLPLLLTLSGVLGGGVGLVYAARKLSQNKGDKK